MIMRDKKPFVVALVLLMSLVWASAVMAAPSADAAPESTGRICVNAFSDDNGDGQPDATEGYIAGVTFTVANETAIIGQGVSTGTEDPVCFESVEPGEYQVAQTLPSRLEATTASNADVSVTAGNTVGLAFGSRLELAPATAEPVEADGAMEETDSAETATDTAETTAEPAEDDGASGIITAATVGVIALVVLVLGGLLFWVLRR